MKEGIGKVERGRNRVRTDDNIDEEGGRGIVSHEFNFTVSSMCVCIKGERKEEEEEEGWLIE